MSTVAMTPTADGDIMVLLSTANGYAFHKMMANGDSLWTQFHNRPTTGSIYRFRECSDRGFIACGTFNGFAGNEGYILKTDSLARLLPDNLVTVSGSLEFCNGDSVVLTAQPVYSYQWNQGSASQSIIVNTEGCYYVAVFDSLGNYAYSDSFCVIIHTPVTPLVTYLNDTLYSTFATTYQWYQGSVMIAGATNQFYVPSMNDFYHVVITDSTGCSASSADYQVTNVGVDGISGSLKPVLFPNPGKENSVIRITNLPAGNYELVVFDAIGKMILSKTIESSSSEIVVPTDKLRSGSYQIKLSNGKNVVNMHFDIL
ncbi:MAG: T9SS type A sorting domain-containing protein [Bacteroidia bacterium]